MTIEMDLSDAAAWKERYRASVIAWSRVASGNPRRGLVCSNKDGVYQLYAWDRSDDSLRQLTDDPVGVGGGVISANGEHVYHLRDNGGDEKGHYVRMPFDGGESIDITPEMPDYASHYFSECHSGRAYGFTAADDDGFRILLYDKVAAGAKLFDKRWTALTFGPVLSHDAEIALVASTEKTGVMEYALEAYDVASGELIGELWDGEGSGMQAAAFSPLPGDMRLAATSSASGFRRPLIWNLATGERHDIVHESFAGDVPVVAWSPDGERLLLNQWHQARQSLYIYHVARDEVRPVSAPSGTGGAAGYFLENGNLMLHFSDGANPPRLLEVDSDSGAVLRDVFDLNASLPASRGFRSVTYESDPGVAIQAWLATPAGEGPFPTIVHTHGGPTAVQTNSWMPAAQSWLDHGFAFFSINYRGSTTFGYDFQHAIDGDLGAREARDIAAGVKWLVDNGIADPSAILKTGGSYGGYLTLLALGKRPELWAGGMAVVAIADWTLMYEDQAETLRGYQRSMFRGTPDELPEAHRRASPITYAENYNCDLLVIQGANDTRCPARQMRVFEERLKDLGKSIELRWFDAGHGSRAVEQSIEQQEWMLEFAARALQDTDKSDGSDNPLAAASDTVANKPLGNAPAKMRSAFANLRARGIRAAEDETEVNETDESDRMQRFARSAITAAMKMPGAKVDRESFLRTQLRSYVSPEAVGVAIDSSPAKAEIPGQKIDRIADSVIKSHVVKAAGLSFFAGVPGGLASAITIPADTAQFVWHAIVLAQKLAYLYGWPALTEQDSPDDETELRIIMLIGAMLGVDNAQRIMAELAKQFAHEIRRRVPRYALTKTAYYPVVKEVLKWFGIRLTKQSFADGVATVVPVLSGATGAAITAVALRSMARNLRKHLRELEFAEHTRGVIRIAIDE